MTFAEIVADVESPLIIAAPLGEAEEFLVCDGCNRLVRARPEAFQLHEEVTCALYQQGQEQEAGL